MSHYEFKNYKPSYNVSNDSYDDCLINCDKAITGINDIIREYVAVHGGGVWLNGCDLIGCFLDICEDLEGIQVGSGSFNERLDHIDYKLEMYFKLKNKKHSLKC